MNSKTIAVVCVLAIGLAACQRGGEPVRAVWTDPVSGEESTFLVSELGPWKIHALAEDPVGLMILSRDGKPLIGYDELSHFGAISIHNNGQLTSGHINLYDTNGDGVFDTIEAISPEGGQTPMQIRLKEGRWSISRQLPNQAQ